ncbi:MAG: hypothetical protein EB140_10095 [Proteobacteria bacterium]|nr:hypothetical protein [Pseudomonadota bacterium]
MRTRRLAGVTDVRIIHPVVERVQSQCVAPSGFAKIAIHRVALQPVDRFGVRGDIGNASRSACPHCDALGGDPAQGVDDAG